MLVVDTGAGVALMTCDEVVDDVSVGVGVMVMSVDQSAVPPIQMDVNVLAITVILAEVSVGKTDVASI